MSKEKEIENSIVEYLRMNGFMCWANENTGVFDPVQRKFRTFNLKYKYLGASDIFALSPNGFFCAFEVKDPKEHEKIDRQLEKWLKKSRGGYVWSKPIETVLNQYKFIEMIKKNKGLGGFVSSLQHVDQILSLQDM